MLRIDKKINDILGKQRLSRREEERKKKAPRPEI